MAGREMYERVFGAKYEQAKNLGYAEIAKLVRADIKQAVKLGVLPGTVKDYSVRSDSFSMGGSVDVTVMNHTHLWVECDGMVPGTKTVHEDGMASGTACGNIWCASKGGNETHRVLTVEGQEVEKTTTWLLNRYNYDGSESQVDYFDVHFYGHVKIETETEQGWRLREVARKAEARKNAQAKKELVDHLVAKHGQAAGRLRRYDHESLLAAHASQHEKRDFDHGVEDLAA